MDIPAPEPFVTAARELISKGRDGKGALVLFAAGNESRVISDDEIYGIPGLITVGATNAFDEAAPYSNQGTPMDVMAPAGTLTTDVRGEDGFDPGDYTSLFSGTSSACPVAAGVAGLLASLLPSARGEDIAAALIDSARPAPYAMPDAQGHDLTYGYGIVDPLRAMEQLVPSHEADSKGGGCACDATANTARFEPVTLGLFALWGLARRRYSALPKR
jgi:subtilisin family serine protease